MVTVLLKCKRHIRGHNPCENVSVTCGDSGVLDDYGVLKMLAILSKLTKFPIHSR